MAHNVEQTYQERILKVMLYIQNHLDNELSLDELAQTAFFSPFHFHRIFTAYTGESIKSYVRRLRLERATRDLSFTDLSITQIAERAGYDTQQSFHRAFKETYRETPKAYRDKTVRGIADKFEGSTEKPVVEIKNVAPIPVAFIRHVGPYHETYQAWFQLISEIGMPQITSPSTLKINIPYDTPETTPENKLRCDACVSLEGLENFKPKGKVGVQTLHGGKYAVITHRGPLELIDATYQILFGLWLPHSGYEPADHPNFMLHRTLPFETAPADLVTDIYLPLK